MLFIFFVYIPVGFHLSVGPVLGLITNDSVKILIETPVATTVSFHLFALDSSLDPSQEGEYLSSQVKPSVVLPPPWFF
jgi:hypothetical protein